MVHLWDDIGNGRIFGCQGGGQIFVENIGLCSWKVCEVVRKGEVMGRGVVFVGLWWRRVVFVFVWLANLERL